MLLQKIRQTFELKSSILRADFVELQRQEAEMLSLESFIKQEFRQERSKDVIQSIQTYQTHKSYFESVKKQRLVVRETGELEIDVKSLLSTNGDSTPFVCDKCNGDDKIDFKRELL